MDKTTYKNRHSRHHHDVDLSEDLEKIKAAIMDATADARYRAGEIFADSADNVRRKSAELKDSTSNYIAEQPLKSVGIALVVGALIGYLLRK